MLVSWDTEYRFDTDPITGPQVQPMSCLSWAGEDGWRGVRRVHDGAKEIVGKILTHHVSAGVSIANDVAVACREWPEFIPLAFQAYEEGRIRCLKVEGKLLDIAEDQLNRVAGAANPKAPYGMESLAWRYCQRTVRADKDELRRTFGGLRDVPFDQWSPDHQKYPQEDADVGLTIAQHIPDAGPDKWRQAKYAFMARLWTAHGVRTDLERVARLKVRLESDWMRHKALLLDAGMIRWERVKWVRSEKKMRDYVSTRPGAVRTDPSKTYPQGQWSLNGVLLEEIGLFHDDPLCLAWSKFSSIAKRLSTEIPALERGEIHAFYDSCNQTGRMNCGAEDDDDESSTNLTNLPRKGGIRECYVPRPGKVYYDADCDALEAKTGAQACLDLVGTSTMADVLTCDKQNPGKMITPDIHLHTAAAIARCTVEEAVSRYKGHSKWINSKGAEGRQDEEIATCRQFAKIANYGLSGGMGVKTFYKHIQKELKKDGQWDLARKTTEDEAYRVWKAWRERYPEWPRYFSRNGQRLENAGGFVQFKQLYSGRVRGIGGFNAYATLNNTAFQGLGADLTKAWAWRVTRDQYDFTRRSVLYGTRNCIYAHDSLTGECELEAGHDVCKKLEEHLRDESPNWTPDVPASTTGCLTMRFSKNAKDIVDKATGRLIPWDDVETAA